jgi:Rrf2 family protein
MMLDVARVGAGGDPVSLAGVAERSHISHGYLEQLALPLRNARLLRGVCGKGGGYRLARPAERITVREIIEAVDGPLNVVECVGDPASCIRAEFCECRPMYVLINRRVTDALEGFTLADLLTPEGRSELEAKAVAPGPRARRRGGTRRTADRRGRA